MIAKAKLEEKIREISGRAWMPVEVARLNDQIIRLVVQRRILLAQPWQ